jgi:hypothetical protein
VQDAVQSKIDRYDYLSMNLDDKVRNAIQIARKFLEQYNSPVVFRSAIVLDTTCKISMEVGLTQERIVQVTIDTASGRIIEYKR